jgi:hypothetical protein
MPAPVAAETELRTFRSAKDSVHNKFVSAVVTHSCVFDCGPDVRGPVELNLLEQRQNHDDDEDRSQ